VASCGPQSPPSSDSSPLDDGQGLVQNFQRDVGQLGRQHERR
jgi:hypothetical protein